MKAFIRFLLGDPLGRSADGGTIGAGLSAALRKHYSAQDAEHYLRQWSAERQDVRDNTTRH
ncbi:hypothetical protein ACGFJC_01400 [Nonomuraea fuscirosea]|uniref:Uncharacterized protein n=1 Tax=Nonomuraea fuscirosea TaxID=1291556 RepID=A0A2T0N9A9_9ACTN|nr:hypothetical protein [Nonomuraea fuscirosea]PRX69374.1 hypothetical protein B0I32_102431 [Nonomuraea fuscirosea]